jgi:hypothetical protein
MPTSTSSKARAVSAPPKPVTSVAFGVSITMGGAQAAEKPAMSRNRKAMIWLGGIAIAAALVLYLQYRSSGDADPEAADHPGVTQVRDLASKKDAGGLAQMTRDGDTVVASRAVEALARVGGVDAVRDSLYDPRPEVRAAAVSQMGMDPDVGQLPVLSQYLADPEPAVRIAAIRSVAAIRDFSIFDHLMPMLQDPQPIVRKGAQAVIEERLGLTFSDLEANGSQVSRQRAIARMQAMLPNLKRQFDAANQFEENRKRK